MVDGFIRLRGELFYPHDGPHLSMINVMLRTFVVRVAVSAPSTVRPLLRSEAFENAEGML